MKCTILKPIDIEVKYLDVYLGSRIDPEYIELSDNEYSTWEDVMNVYPTVVANLNNKLQCFLRIDVETGKVINWPDNKFGDFRSIKVVDEGTYILKDSMLNDIVKFEGYVPTCLEIEDNGWGDYLEFTISDGYINNWEFGQDDVEALFEIH